MMASSLRPSSTFLARSGVVADQRAKRPARAAAVVRASAPQQQPPNGTRSKPGPARAAYTAEYVSSATWNAAPAQQQHWGAPPAPHGLKDSLLLAVNDTKRGALTTRDVRGEVEELQVALESFQGAQDLDYSLLPGLWELKYTTSEEVIPIINWGNILSGFWGEGPLRSGKIFQRFSEPDADGKGRLDNIVLFSLPLLEERQGVRLTVNIDYTVRSGHMLDLEFNTANFTNVRVSEQLESLLAPAALPRLPFQAELLTAIRGINLRLPFRSLTEITGPIWEQVGREDQLGTATGPYQLTYLDDDMLIGRAVTLGSSFIFVRAKEFDN